MLLVGGGVASVRCARTLRRAGFDRPIVLVGSEPVLPYNRPPLSKELLRDDVPDELLLAESAGWYEKRGIEVLAGTTVVELDPADRLATLDDGSRVAFDQCLIATGAEPRRPPIAGAERALVLRTLEDARRIDVLAQPATRVAIVGAGFIGVEVASALAARGARVTVVELAPEPWGGALGDELGRWASAELEAAGVDLLTRSAVTAIETDGIRIGEREVGADVVIIAVGVGPRDGLARGAGLAVNDGVMTDAGHRTSAPDIFAAGDVARVDGVRVEHWHSAREGGERAALAMLGRELPPSRAPWVFSEVAGRQLDVVGSAPSWDETRRIGDANRFAIAYLREGRVAQLAIVDAALPVDDARSLVERRPSFEEAGLRIG